MTLSGAAPSAGEPPLIAVVLPACKSAAQIGAVIAGIPPQVRHVIVGDDASPDDLLEALARRDEDRVRESRRTGTDVVVKLGSDGRMDPRVIPALVAPILAGEADLVEGNRFADQARIRRMPLVRRAGNLALSFLVRLESGYWSLFDPCNGFVALRAGPLRSVEMTRLADRFFFEISLLCEAYLCRARLRDVAMPAVHGNETSSLRPPKTVFEFLRRRCGRAAGPCGRPGRTCGLLVPFVSREEFS